MWDIIQNMTNFVIISPSGPLFSETTKILPALCVAKALPSVWYCPKMYREREAQWTRASKTTKKRIAFAGRELGCVFEHWRLGGEGVHLWSYLLSTFPFSCQFHSQYFLFWVFRLFSSNFCNVHWFPASAWDFPQFRRNSVACSTKKWPMNAIPVINIQRMFQNRWKGHRKMWTHTNKVQICKFWQVLYISKPEGAEALGRQDKKQEQQPPQQEEQEQRQEPQQQQKTTTNRTHLVDLEKYWCWKNEDVVANIGFDTAKNGSFKIWITNTFSNYPRCPPKMSQINNCETRCPRIA